MNDLKKAASLAVAGVSLLGATLSKTSADGFAAGWSDWNENKQNGVANEKSKNQWATSYVKEWSACDGNHTTKPSNIWYKEGTYRYNPWNCARDCGWYSWHDGWTSYYSCGETYYYSCWYYAWTYKVCWSTERFYGIAKSYDCSRSEQRWTTCSGWRDKTCSEWHDGWTEWVGATCWDGSCDWNSWKTAACYQVPTSWNTWSQWYDEYKGPETADFKITSRTLFSYPGRLGTPTVSVSPEGIVTWNSVANANKYQISIDNSNWIDAYSGYNFKSTIIAQTGQRTVYVRAMDSNNVLLTSYSGSYTVNVYTVSFDTKGGSAVGSIRAINGGTVTLPSGSTLRGYTFKEWKRVS